MNVLALDTTTRDGSVAFVVDDRVVDERRGDATRSHAERLPAELVSAAAAHGVAIGDVDLFAVAAGPGSFTGLRIGIATVQGLAFVEGRSVVAVSALDALAQIASAPLEPGALVGAWVDAQRRDVYAALYRVADALPFTPERLTTIHAPEVGDPVAILDGWMRDDLVPVCLVGDGGALCRWDRGAVAGRNCRWRAAARRRHRPDGRRTRRARRRGASGGHSAAVRPASGCGGRSGSPVDHHNGHKGHHEQMLSASAWCPWCPLWRMGHV